LLYSEVVDIYSKMESTTKRLELVSLLAELFKRTPPNLLDKLAYLSLGRLYPDYVGVELGIAEKLAVRAIAAASGRRVQEVETLYKASGDLGIAAERAIAEKVQTTFWSESLTLERVYDTLDRIARTAGQRSVETKLKMLESLLNHATPMEARYIVRTVTGKLRLGVADYTLLDAAAEVFTGGKENRVRLERAYNICSDIGLVIKTVAEGGLEAIDTFKVMVGRPVRPMLAERVSSAEEAVQGMEGRCAVEYKLDGERLQIHKDGNTVKIFSRRLEEITHHYPDVVQLTRDNVRAETAILEAEAVAIDEDTRELRPFQELMHRRRKYGIEKAMKEFPVALFFFDILFLDGEDLTSRPFLHRRAVLEETVVRTPKTEIVPMLRTGSPSEIETFMEKAVTEGSEGVMIKNIDSVYRAGARGFEWVKLKREYKAEIADTFDLAIVGAFHGRGRRAGTFGAYLCATYNKERDLFEVTTKVGTGFSDEDLRMFTEKLTPLVLPGRHPRVESRLEADVWVEPKIVIEVIASEITVSPTHVAALDAVKPGCGLALRFPKYTGRLREDKRPEDATTSQELIEMYRLQLRRIQAAEGEAP
jgi:DNA ligase-1